MKKNIAVKTAPSKNVSDLKNRPARTNMPVKGTRTKIFRRPRFNVSFLSILLVVAVSAYIVREFPEIAARYPAIFWAAKIFAQVGELGLRLYKLIIQGLADILPLPGHSPFQGWWSNLQSNWGFVKEAFVTLLKLLV